MLLFVLIQLAKRKEDKKAYTKIVADKFTIIFIHRVFYQLQKKGNFSHELFKQLINYGQINVNETVGYLLLKYYLNYRFLFSKHLKIIQLFDCKLE